MNNKTEKMKSGAVQKARYTKLNGAEVTVSKPMEIVNARERAGGEHCNGNIRQETPDHTTQSRTLHDHLAVKRKHRLSSNNATESSSEPNSLNESSSVEVLSELDDEAKFENSLSSFNQFEN